MKPPRYHTPHQSALTFVALACAAGAVAKTQLLALKAAGLTGTEPPGGAAFATLISDLTDNWKWLIITGIGLVLIILAGLMMVGSRTAPDWLFKLIGGVVLILVVIPAVLK